MSISLAAANAIATTALRIARERHLAPLTVCILDTGAHLVCAQREDNSSTMRFEIAEGKAYAALGIGRSTRFLQETLTIQRRGFVEALSVAAHGKFIPVAGGLLIRSESGIIVKRMSGDVTHQSREE